MKFETFDSALRSTWQLVSKMYNKEANKFDSTMATRIVTFLFQI